jgi:immune inhibitor A
MSKEGRSSTGWIVIGILSVMAICLCVFTVTASSVFLLWHSLKGTRVSYESTPDPALSRDTIDLLSHMEVPLAYPVEIAERLCGLNDIPEVLAQEAEPLSLGTVTDFWISDVDRNESRLAEMRLEYIGAHVYFWVETDVDVDPEDVERVVRNFEEVSYPTVRSLIGEEWSPGIDGDRHLYILYVEGLGPSVAGLYFPKDEYSPLVHEQSNGHEMVYLSADNVSLKANYADSVLAHEFQHLVHWNLDRNEETWINEGFSELLELVLGFEMGGFDYLYSRDTDKPLTRWPSDAESAGEHYGQAFLFSTYIYDRFGSDMIRAIANNPANGLDAIDLTLEERQVEDPMTGKAISADDVFLDWAVTLALQDIGLVDGRYGLQSYINAPVAHFSDAFDRCPIGEKERTINQYGVDLIQLKCQGTYTLQFVGETEKQVLPTDPHSGEFAFWSNEGDDADMTLTRLFDFRDTQGPIFLEYWTWYSIEEGYDYVYLEISTDHGDTWEILETPSGTDEDPSGNSFGWGYNGISGRESQPSWVEERIDLSRFAGQEILLRFEYVTDTAVNAEGFLLDDLSITGIGYSEDFELGEGDWTAEGFIRLYNHVPQTYRIALIERGDEFRVREVELDSRNQGNVSLEFDDKTEDIILVVTATSRYSWLPADYRFQVMP